MNTTQLQSRFQHMGARVAVRPLEENRWRTPVGPVRSVVIDIGHDRAGEYFDIQASHSVDMEVVDVQPRDRHLLLLVRQPATRRGVAELKDKFLCGHDERHWFVAAVPEKRSVSNVITAKEALKPASVLQLEHGLKGKFTKRQRRRTDTFVRQGEWFFIPAREVKVKEKLVMRNEPLSRGRGKPHMCEWLYALGGRFVYVCSQYPDGLDDVEYEKLVKKRPETRRWNWRCMRRDPVVYVRGKVSHADHATIRLDDWHRVQMNTENESRAMAHVAFLD